MNRQLVDAIARLPDDVVPVVLIFMYPDGRAAMQAFSTTWKPMAQVAANELVAKAEVEAMLKRH